MLIRIFTTLILAYLLWQGLKLFLLIYKVLANVRVATNAHRGHYSQEPNLDLKTMVKCAKCQLYILDKDAVIYDSRPYCCKDHALSPS